MKRTRLFLMVLAAMLSVGLCSCEKENNNGSDGNGGETPGGGTSVEWVDLGLPSGRLWASCNLGATKPEEYGDYCSSSLFTGDPFGAWGCSFYSGYAGVNDDWYSYSRNDGFSVRAVR